MPTKKLALFVEGQTEFIFLRELLLGIVGTLVSLRIEGFRLVGNTVFSVGAARGHTTANAEFLITLFNCQNDGKVVTAMRDRYTLLVADGFTTILGVRDLFGDKRKYSDRAALLARLNDLLPKGAASTSVILAVMEIEAWFLRELDHLSKFDPALTSEYILEKLGVDLTTCDVEKIHHPSKVLDDIFKLVASQYDKKEAEVEAIVSRLDFTKMYIADREKVSSLDELLTELDCFFYA